MSTRYNNGSHYENHPQAAEQHDGAAHSYRVAEQNGQQDHLNGHEQSRLDTEHFGAAYWHPQARTVGHGMVAFGHHEIEALAHKLWADRGCPQGSPDEDWFRAVNELRTRNGVH